MFRSLSRGLSRATRFFAGRNEKSILIEALERREIMSAGSGDGDIENLPPSGSGFNQTYLQLGTPSLKIDLWGMFSDETPPDLLSYSPGSNSDPILVPDTQVIGNRYLLLTFNPEQKDSHVYLSVVATDPQGLTGEAQLELVFDSLTNNAPLVVSSGDVSVNQGSAPLVINLDAIFDDLGTDDSLLTFAFSSNNNTKLVTSAVVTGHNLTLTFAPDKSGHADVWVICKDPSGNQTGHPISVLVQPPEDTGGGGGEEPPNSAPIAFSVAPIVVELGVTTTKIDLWQYFQDSETPAYDLTFAVSGNTNNDFILSTAFSADQRYLTVNLSPSKVDSGTLTITCTDPEFLFITNDFSISSSEAVNNPPTVVNSATINVNQDSDPVFVDLNNVFEDFISPDSKLTFSVSSFSNPGLISSAKIDGKNLVVAFNAHKAGAGGITVVATDPQGNFTPYLVEAFVTDVYPLVGALRVDQPIYRLGAPGLADVDFTVSGVVAEGNKVAIYLDSDSNGSFNSAIDKFLAFTTTSVGALRVASADLSKLAAGDYTILALGQEDLGDGTFQYGSAVSTAIHIVGADKSLVSAKNVVTYTDLHGSTVKVTLTGPGALEVFFDTAAAKRDPSLIQITGSDASKSSLTFTVTPTKGSAFTTTDIRDLSVEGGLSAINAGKANLGGDLTATGLLKAITLADVNELVTGQQHSISFAGTASDKSTITLGSVNNISLTSGATVSIKALEWIDGNLTPDAIKVAGLSSLNITGFKSSSVLIRGSFDADLSLTRTGPLKVAPVISSIAIAGDTSGDWNLGLSKTQSITIKGHATGHWDTSASIGSVTIGNKANNLHVSAAGDIASFKAGQTSDTFIHSDAAIGAISTVNFIGGSISADKANSITITGQKASVGVSAVAGNFTGMIDLSGQGSKAGASVISSISVAGLAVGSAVASTPEWNIRGGAGSITIGSAQNLHVQIGMGTEAGLTSFKSGQATNVDLQVALKIGSVTAPNWTGGSISAGTLGSLSITGTTTKTGVVGGDFTGKLHFNAIGLAKNGLTIQSISIAGTALGDIDGETSDWFANGSVGSIAIGQVHSLGIFIAPLSASVMGNLASLKTGDANQLRLDVAGKAGSIAAKSFTNGYIRADSIGSLTTTGNFASHLQITAKHLAKNTPGLGSASIGGSATGAGSLESPEWQIAGSTGPLTFGAINGLTIHADDNVASITVKGEAKTFNLLADGHFDEVSAKSSFGNVGAIKAARISNAYIQADKIASISATGLAATKGSALIVGDILNSYIYVTGGGVSSKLASLGGLTVSGTLDNSGINVVSGNVGPVSLGAMRDSTLFVAVADDLPAGQLPTSDAGFASTAFAIASFTITGKPVATNAASFLNSRVIAGTLTNVSLKLVSPLASEGSQSGFAAAFKIGSYTRLQAAGPKITVSNKTTPGTYDTLGEYVLKIV
jgi:hypothetical protein